MYFLLCPASRGELYSLAHGPFLCLQSQQQTTLKSLSYSDIPISILQEHL